MKIVAFVPAKSTSDRIGNKNTAILDGEYLFKRKLIQLKSIKNITDVYLDTDSDEIGALADGLGVKRLFRPAELASNATDGHELFAFECAHAPDADIYIQALCTAPFVDAGTIERALDLFLKAPNARSLVAVNQEKHYVWDGNGPAYGLGRIPNSIDLPQTVIEAMSLYMVRRFPGEALPTRRFSPDALLFPLTPRENLDINFPADLELAENICAGDRARQRLELNLLKLHLSSPILADICKETGWGRVLPPEFRRFSGSNLLGTAKTLQLVELPDSEKAMRSEAWKGIYRALDSYQFIRPGDVIVVSTNVPTRAYFGDLNAHLAIRAGAEGAIIGGFTRDTPAMRQLGFCIFAQGSYCDDIKYEGTLDSLNRSIHIGDIEIANNDVIFADDDGIVVIAARHWHDLKQEAWRSLKREASIRLKLLEGAHIESILKQHGSF